MLIRSISIVAMLTSDSLAENRVVSIGDMTGGRKRFQLTFSFFYLNYRDVRGFKSLLKLVYVCLMLLEELFCFSSSAWSSTSRAFARTSHF